MTEFKPYPVRNCVEAAPCGSDSKGGTFTFWALVPEQKAKVSEKVTTVLSLAPFERDRVRLNCSHSPKVSDL